ncbi:hypothetical protein K438DRAFT_1967077 [Mycena galopus ATCC 62051]|nr:hypothetical protein K438DRAFT_1967077 [Mycena galopus ATCC 62051]
MSTLETDRTRAAFLEAQILDLEVSIAALRLEQALIQQRLQSFIYPVLTLPNEIVAEIFIHVLPPYPSCPPLTGPLSPTSLTYICRAWREIAVSTPELWTAIQLPFNDIPVQQQLHVSDVWLKRSGACPLSIELDGIDDGDEWVDVSKPMQVAPHRTRWEYLKLKVSLSQFSALGAEGSMPLLRHLNLQISRDSLVPAARDIVFGELPLLRTVALNDIAAARVVLPWMQLTSLTLYRVYLRECVPILQQTSNLVYCELYIFSFPGGTGDIITLPSLESLVLNDPALRPFTRYLESFVTPALRSLRIQEQSLGPDPIRSLIEFISKSRCKLQEVCITGKRSVARASYREEFPSIPRLYFNHNPDPSNETDSPIEDSSVGE